MLDALQASQAPTVCVALTAIKEEAQPGEMNTTPNGYNAAAAK